MSTKKKIKLIDLATLETKVQTAQGRLCQDDPLFSLRSCGGGQCLDQETF